MKRKLTAFLSVLASVVGLIVAPAAYAATYTITFEDLTPNTNLKGVYQGIDWGSSSRNLFIRNNVATSNTSNVLNMYLGSAAGTFVSGSGILDAFEIINTDARLPIAYLVEMTCGGQSISNTVPPGGDYIIPTHFNTPCSGFTLADSGARPGEIYWDNLQVQTTAPTLLGKNTIGATAIGAASGVTAYPYTGAGTGVVNTIWLYVGTEGGTNQAGNIQVGIYTDNNNVPGNLIGQCTIPMLPGYYGRWNACFTGPAISITQGVHYWLAEVLETPNWGPVFRYTNANAGGLNSSDTVLPAVWQHQVGGLCCGTGISMFANYTSA